MNDAISRIAHPEIVIGLVAPVGTDLTEPVVQLRRLFSSFGYRVFEIKVTSVFKILSRLIENDLPLTETGLAERYNSYISFGNRIREKFNDDSALAAFSILKTVQQRNKLSCDPQDKLNKNVFIINQLKREEEISLLRSIYGRCFFQISLYSTKESRIQSLSERFASDNHSAITESFRPAAEALVLRDENEVRELHGQRVSRIFHNADVIVSSMPKEKMISQIERFAKLLFGSNGISPTKSEYGMFAAKAAALRTLDLSRQVGAAIFSPDGEIISLGSNEVPKGDGGTYWEDDIADGREFRLGFDANQKRKYQLVSEVLSLFAEPDKVNAQLSDSRLQSAQIMDLIEYGRIIHAEMSAICDAARLGRSLKGSVLYSTTFPCHICAKHIVASGIKKVVFLEPYPKSLAGQLHRDSICVEGAHRGDFDRFPVVNFEHFSGITPRRYREFFEKRSRKDKDGRFLEWQESPPQPFIDLKFPFYVNLESAVIENILKPYFRLLNAEFSLDLEF